MQIGNILVTVMVFFILMPISYNLYYARMGDNLGSVTQVTELAGFNDNFQSGTFTYASDDEYSPNEKWHEIYRGGGSSGVRTTAGNNVYWITPAVATSAGVTHAGLSLSNQTFVNIDASMDMRTKQQLRIGSTPNSWEVGWIMLKYVDNKHHYYLALKSNDQFEFGKKDNPVGDNTPEDQIFLRTGSFNFDFNAWYKVEWDISGQTITIWVNGTKIVDNFVDNGVLGNHFDANGNFVSANRPQTSILAGAGSIGMYNEDAESEYDNVIVNGQTTTTVAGFNPDSTTMLALELLPILSGVILLGRFLVSIRKGWKRN